jgi:hypothetical protein
VPTNTRPCSLRGLASREPDDRLMHYGRDEAANERPIDASHVRLDGNENCTSIAPAF